MVEALIRRMPRGRYEFSDYIEDDVVTDIPIRLKVAMTIGDGEIHLDHLLLTPRGLVVIDLRNAHGAVFGGEQMDDWTVMSATRRYTFRNPLGALAARVHAVRRLAGQGC